MANFAQINGDGLVENVIVADQSFIDSAALRDHSGTFKEITTTGGRGWTDDSVKDKFIEPQPFPSWTLNSNDEWEAPVTEPAVEEEKIHIWNEENQQWDIIDRPLYGPVRH